MGSFPEVVKLYTFQLQLNWLYSYSRTIVYTVAVSLISNTNSPKLTGLGIHEQTILTLTTSKFAFLLT